MKLQRFKHWDEAVMSVKKVALIDPWEKIQQPNPQSGIKPIADPAGYP